MLTGKVPFGGEGYGEIIVKHVTHQAPSVRKINPQVSAAVEVILFRALAKDRNDRFQSMEDFREALLDPEAYLETVPEFGLPAELTGVTRLAAPMSRSEMNFAGVVLDSSDAMSGIPTPPGPYPLTPVGSGAIPVLTPGPASTFRNATGQLAENVVLTRRSGRKVVFGMLVGVALAGAVIVGFGRKGRTPPPAPARLPTATTTPVTVVPKRPSAVRLNFTSDPAGATVTRGDDGTVLGTTPLSLEVAYSDSAVPFVLSKNGYEVKRIYVVPNLPAPLFANLKALTPSPDPAAEKAARERSAGHSSRSARKATAKPAPAEAAARSQRSGGRGRRPRAKLRLSSRRRERFGGAARRLAAHAVPARGLRRVQVLVGALDQRVDVVGRVLDASHPHRDGDVDRASPRSRSPATRPPAGPSRRTSARWPDRSRAG